MSVVWPWVVFFTALFGVLLLNNGEQIPRGPVADVVFTLYGDNWIGAPNTTTEFAYGATFMIAGPGGVALSSLLYRRTDLPERVSE